MASGEVEFLRDQVRRLNAELATYQQKFSGANTAEEKSLPQEDITAPWLTDKSFMSPLLQEYDFNLKEQANQIGVYKDEQKRMKTEMDRLLAENRRLMRELRENVETQINYVDGDTSEATTTDVGDEQLLRNVQHQLAMAIQEKDSAMDMWQTAIQEVERLERHLQDCQLDPQLRVLESKAAQMQSRYTKSVEEINSELELLQAERSKLKSEIKTLNTQLADSRKTIEDLLLQLSRKEREEADAMERDEEKGDKLVQAQRRIADIEEQLFTTTKESNQLQTEKAHLEKRTTDLQKKIGDLEQREYEIVVQMRDSVQMVENAMLEKDQALMREQQTDQQLQKLQEALNQLLDDAGARTRQEVDNVKKQCNKNMESLMDELYALEMDNGEKQAQLERAVREKRAVESELEKIYQEGLVQGRKDSGTYDELNRRACQAERTRDEALMKLESLKTTLKTTEASAKHEKELLETQVTQMKDRITQMNLEFDSVNDDRMKFLGEIEELKKKLQTLQQEKEACDRKFNKDMSCFEQKQQLREREYEVKLQSIEDCHRHAMSELRQLLSSQQRMSSKWKEECQSIANKYELKMKDLRNEVNRHKKRSEELAALLSDSKDKLAQSENMLIEYTRTIKKLEDRVRESEQRSMNAAQQISRQLTRERQMLRDRKDQPLDRSTSLRPSLRISDALGMSELVGGERTASPS